MKKAKKTPITLIAWSHEVHELPGRTVTIAEVQVPVYGTPRTKAYRGVSIRNPHDCPLRHDGVKFALTRALKNAKLSKTKRRLVWQDFLGKFPNKKM